LDITDPHQLKNGFLSESYLQKQIDTPARQPHMLAYSELAFAETLLSQPLCNIDNQENQNEFRVLNFKLKTSSPF